MEIKFSKYQGAGNDFIIIDDRSLNFDVNNEKLIAQFCDRNIGIGADGLILLRNHPRCDFEMLYFNSDGNPSSMCGNGGRCLVDFAYKLGIISENCSFIAPDGWHNASWSQDEITLSMTDIKEVEKIGDDYFMDTGSPHYVRFVDELVNYPLILEAQQIRFGNRFNDHGTNVNFIELHDDILKIRTYERGVEGETLACGTGVVASAIATFLYRKEHKNNFVIETLGGKMSVSFNYKNEQFTNVELKGPATFVYEGKILC